MPPPQQRISAHQEVVESFGPAFARTTAFWWLSLLSLLVGLLVGFIGWLHIYVVYVMNSAWIQNNFQGQLSGFFTGRVWYIGVVAGAGFTNGLIQVIPFFRYPRRLTYLFGEIKSLHAHWEAAPSIILANTIALGLGASIGPEAAIAAMGAAVASFMSSFEVASTRCRLSTRKRRMFVLVGMAGAISSVFPAPPIAVLLVYEIFLVSEEHFEKSASNDTRDYLEFIALSGLCASVSYAVLHAMIIAVNEPYKTFSDGLKPNNTPFAGAAPALGMLAGLIGSALSYLFLFCQLVFSRVALRIKRKIDTFGPSSFSLGRLLLPVIGGAMSGIIGWICPLTIGSGLEPLISLSEEINITPSETPVIFASSLLKIVSLALCLSTGMTGGIIYPLFFIGGSMGTAISAYTGWDRLTLTASLSASALASHIPAPIALWGMAIVMFNGGVGDDWSTWLAVIIAVVVGCSLGVKEDIFDLVSLAGRKRGSTRTSRRNTRRNTIQRIAVLEHQLYLNTGIGDILDDELDEKDEIEGDAEGEGSIVTDKTKTKLPELSK
ncbi:hypothetical protein TrCOL_g10862 [Triparma columacea]|uniref:Chloride channel protein n=1 Tax=Triparma columacea TaxID=722753 RepID=A0A9W7FXV1_9STRA|nr:hypothetical protein TrCOL_g10862 [Triparma columacea]